MKFFKISFILFVKNCNDHSNANETDGEREKWNQLKNYRVN